VGQRKSDGFERKELEGEKEGWGNVLVMKKRWKQWI
jgi:hypothetical protein